MVVEVKVGIVYVYCLVIVGILNRKVMKVIS